MAGHFFPPHTLKLVCVRQNPAKARCIHTKIHTDLNHKIIHSVLCFYDIYMNLATASSSSSQRENCSIYVVETGWTWFLSKERKKYPFFPLVTNLELKRTILHYFVTIFLTEDQKRWESLPLSPVSSKAISRYLWNREAEWRHLEILSPSLLCNCKRQEMDVLVKVERRLQDTAVLIYFGPCILRTNHFSINISNFFFQIFVWIYKSCIHTGRIHDI